MKKNLPPKNMDAYIAIAPKEVQVKLKQLRDAIRQSAPLADESISYGMPYYKYKGRLAYFAFAKAHIGLYIPTPILEEHQKELEAYYTTKATLRLPLDSKLPIALIKKLIKARMIRNDSLKKKI